MYKEKMITQEVVGKKYSQSLSSRLKEEAGKSAAFNAMCHIFAMRERSRSVITIHNLIVSMSKEGFNFTKKEYTDVLTFLGSVGLGKLDYDSKGRLRALKNITATLQSIGLTALSKRETIQRQLVKDKQRTVRQVEVQEKPTILEEVSNVTLVIKSPEKTVEFALSQETTAKCLFIILGDLYAKKT